MEKCFHIWLTCVQIKHYLYFLSTLFALLYLVFHKLGLSRNYPTDDYNPSQIRIISIICIEPSVRITLYRECHIGNVPSLRNLQFDIWQKETYGWKGRDWQGDFWEPHKQDMKATALPTTSSPHPRTGHFLPSTRHSEACFLWTGNATPVTGLIVTDRPMLHILYDKEPECHSNTPLIMVTIISSVQSAL